MSMPSGIWFCIIHLNKRYSTIEFYLPVESYCVLINIEELLNEKCLDNELLWLIFFCNDVDEDVSIIIFTFYQNVDHALVLFVSNSISV